MNRLVKLIIGLALFAVVVLVLFEYVFPWVDENLITDPVMESQGRPALTLG
ncbi:MAG TPA: hypothetical protein VM307_03005 [Egibacteraceae bacterium]|nr:hypothetical protein [Egibacteraceae bacterium]